MIDANLIRQPPFRERQTQHQPVIFSSRSACGSFLAHYTGITPDLDLAEIIDQVHESNDAYIGYTLLPSTVHLPFFVGCIDFPPYKLRQFTMPLVGPRHLQLFQECRNARQSRQTLSLESLVCLQLSAQGFRPPSGVSITPDAQCLSKSGRVGTQCASRWTPRSRRQAFAPISFCPTPPFPHSRDCPSHLRGNLRVAIPLSRHLVYSDSVLQARNFGHLFPPHF